MRFRRAALTLALAVGTAGLGLVTASPAQALSPCMNPDPPEWCFDDGTTNNPTGTFTSVTRVPSGLTVKGSATDPNGGPVSVDIMVGTVRLGTVVANQTGSTFNATVPVTVEGTSVCAIARNIGLGSDTTLGCKAFSVRTSPYGALEVASIGGGAYQVTGWAVDPDTSSSISVKVIANFDTFGPYVANLYRPDLSLSGSQGYGYYHGYNLSVTPNIWTTEFNSVCVVAVNVGAGSDTQLGCANF